MERCAEPVRAGGEVDFEDGARRRGIDLLLATPAADRQPGPAEGEGDPAFVGRGVFRLDAGAVPAAVVAFDPRGQGIAGLLRPAPQLYLVTARLPDVNGPVTRP